MSRLKLAAILCLIGGPIMLFIHFSETNANKKIDREGVEVEAVPMNKILQRGRKGSRTYKLEIQYPTEAAGTQTATVKVSHALYDKIEALPVLKIKYLKETPSELIIVGEPLEEPERMYIGLALLVFGLGGTWWFFLRKSPATAPGEPVGA